MAKTEKIVKTQCIASHKKEEKKVPNLRFPGFEYQLLQTKFGMVVASNKYGPRFNANDYDEEGNVKTIRGTDISLDGEIKYNQAPKAKLDEKFIDSHILEDGDLVMITTADCGLTGVFREQDISYISSAYAVKIKINEKGYPFYFKYFFQTQVTKREINRYIRKATVSNLPGSDILNIRLLLPEIPEQQKIASFLSAVDQKIQQLTSKKKLLEQYKKGVMQKIFSRDIRFRDDNGNDFPDWQEEGLGDVCDCLDNRRIPLNESQRERMKGDIPYWGANNVMDYINDYIFDETIVLLAEDGGYFEEFQTRPISHISYGKCWVNNHAHVLRGKENMLNEYLYCSLVHKNILGYVNVGTRSKLNKSDMFRIKISTPIVEEQKKITDFFSNIDEKITFIKTQIKQTQQFKKGLLQQMFV